MPEIRLLTRGEWLTLRDVRLAALSESPQAFLSSYEREKFYEDDHWQDEFGRGAWYVGYDEHGPISLLGVTRDDDTSADARYLEYMWVAPEYRRRGVAITMLKDVLDQLAKAGVRTVFLWVLDGNDTARHVYERTGFVRTNLCQPLKDRPGRFEERMQLDLA
jgi:GNAT superfamily N-acetyltransferase